VFLTSTPPTRETLKPLISLWLDFMILRLTSQTDLALLPAWVIVDELASLENLPNLPVALAESRKSNTRIVLGLQGRSQVETRYGREAEAMLSQPRTKFFLRTGEPRAAEWVSKSIGDIEIEHLREGRTSGDFGLYYSKNASIDSRIESAILASEISNLDDLQGYFQTPGFTLKLRFPFVPALNLQPAFIERPDLRTFPAGPRTDSAESANMDHGPSASPGDSGVVRHRGTACAGDPDDAKESRSMLQVQ
jgi:type IV secretory pathway TraG/TraD family ATPase VirD4